MQTVSLSASAAAAWTETRASEGSVCGHSGGAETDPTQSPRTIATLQSTRLTSPEDREPPRERRVGVSKSCPTRSGFGGPRLAAEAPGEPEKSAWRGEIGGSPLSNHRAAGPSPAGDCAAPDWDQASEVGRRRHFIGTMVAYVDAAKAVDRRSPDTIGGVV